MSSPALCAPPAKLGEVVLLGAASGGRWWVYGVRKASKPDIPTYVSCFEDSRSLEDILREDNRIRGKGATDLRADRRLPERLGCTATVGYIERNGQGGFVAVVYGRRSGVVSSLRVDTISMNDRDRLVAIVEDFRTDLLGCPQAV